MVGIDLVLALSLGFALGLEHASDADHIVAISTIISENKNVKKAASLGIFWGLGHTITLLLVSIILLTFSTSIPTNLVSFFEFTVGTILIILGVSVIKKGFDRLKHMHPHIHNNKTHIHSHDHNKTEEHNHKHKSFFVGMFHGLAGSATIMLLILPSLNSVFDGLAFILVFGIGSIGGMLIISTLIGLPFALSSKRFSTWNIRIRFIAGFISILLGSIIIYQILQNNHILFF